MIGVGSCPQDGITVEPACPEDGMTAEMESINEAILAVPITSELKVEKAMRNLTLFNTQPHLLDKHLPKWIRHLGECIMKSATVEEKVHPCMLFYAISMVRGLKECMAFLPNDLELLEGFLEAKEPVPEEADWRVRYTLLAWFAILAKQPFDFESVLAGYDAFEKVLHYAHNMAKSSRPERRPAILLLANAVFSSALKSDSLLEVAVECGNLELVYRLVKQNTKTAVDLTAIWTKCDSNREAAKWKCKLLPLLLTTHMANSSMELLQANITKLLFNKDVSTREQMAKSLSKVRLTHDFVDGLVKALPTGNPHESDLPVMHGVCMLIGYGVLRRTVNVQQLSMCKLQVPIERCLWFDYCKGTFSVGSVVRDAACFVVWSWSRRHPASVPSHLLEHTIAMAVLDREVVLRRAAAAAVQEAIGRGVVVEGLLSREAGLQVITMVNYYSVSNGDCCGTIFSNLYHQFPTLRPTLVRNLTENVMPHWDPQMRRMAAAIHKQCQCVDPEWLKTVLEAPVMDLHLFHSSALCYYNSELVGVQVQPVAVFNARDLGAELVLESLLLVMAKQWSGTGDTTLLLVEQAMSFRSDNISTLLHTAILPDLLQFDSEGARKLLLQSLPRADKTTDQWTRCNWIRLFSLVPLWFAERLPSYLRLLLKLLPAVDCKSKVCCLQSIGALIGRFGQPVVHLIGDVTELMTAAFEDYTVDPQEGDIGSLVRLQAIDMVPVVFRYCEGSVLRRHLLIQAVGRLDRLCHHSLRALSTHLRIHTDNMFTYLEQNQDALKEALDGLVYTAGSRLRTDVVEMALGLLVRHAVVLGGYEPGGQRLVSAYRIVKCRMAS